MTRVKPAQLKTVGYLISTVSVILLGAVGWSTVGDDAILRAALVLGVLASIAGMLLRWLSYQRDHEAAEPGATAERGRRGAARQV